MGRGAAQGEEQDQESEQMTALMLIALIMLKQIRISREKEVDALTQRQVQYLRIEGVLLMELRC